MILVYQWNTILKNNVAIFLCLRKTRLLVSKEYALPFFLI